MKFAFLLPVVFLCSAIARAGVAENLLEQLKSELQAEAQTAPAKRESREKEGELLSPKVQRFDRLEELRKKILNYSQLDVDNAALQKSVETLGNFTLSEKIEKLCTALAAELQAGAEKHEQKSIEEMKKTFGEAVRTALAGKTAKDLDRPLASVWNLMDGSRIRDPRNIGYARRRALTSGGEELLAFLRQWQDYLAVKDAGNNSLAQSNLKRLMAVDHDFSSFMPRSELLALLDPLRVAPLGLRKPGFENAPADGQNGNAARQIAASLENIDDLPKTLAKLEKLPDDAPGRSEVSHLISGLRSLDAGYCAMKFGSGDGASFMTTLYSGPLGAPTRRKLILSALPPLLRLPGGEAVGPGESVAAFLKRLLSAAEIKDDWRLVRRIVELGQLAKLRSTYGNSDKNALDDFLAGLNQDRAGQFALAVVSYQAALRSGSQIVPSEQIGVRLDAIRKANSEEFDKGMQLTLNPPSSPTH